MFSAKFACPVCSYALQELEPRLFSFNNPMGACPKCDGLGVIQFFDPKRVVTNPAASLANGAIRGWDKKNQFYFQIIESLAAHYDFSVDTPWSELPEECRQLILYGSGPHQRSIPYSTKRARVSTVATASRESSQPRTAAPGEQRLSHAVREELPVPQHSTCPTATAPPAHRSPHVLFGAKTCTEIAARPLGDAAN